MSTSRRSFLQGLLGSMVTAALARASHKALAAGSETFSVLSIVILSRTGPHRFRVELAESPSQRMQGLQGRQTLDAKAGMLFLFDTPTVATMWMKNTYIPLDMLFLDSVGSIAAIAENARPMSLQSIRPPEPVEAVLELNAGTVARLGIKLGDRVLHPFIEDTAPR
jgi:uncharacterized protein